MTLLTALMILGSPSYAGPSDPRPQFGASESFSEAEEARVLEEIKSRDPERARRLAMVKTRDPARYYDVLKRMARAFERELRDPEARARHERIQAVRHEIQALALDWSTADDGAKKKIRKEMDALANQMFELRQEERRGRLDELRAKLEKAEAEVAQHETRRDEVIAEHLDRLLEEIVQ